MTPEKMLGIKDPGAYFFQIVKNVHHRLVDDQAEQRAAEEKARHMQEYVEAQS